MRLDEINARLAAIQQEAETASGDALTALENEAAALTAERQQILNEMQARQRLRSNIAAGIVTGRTIEAPSAAEPTQARFTVDSAEYREAYLMHLQGRSLSAEQRAAVTATAAIPTQTLNRIVGVFDRNPILSRITMTYIPGNITIPVEGTVNSASWVAVGTASTDSDDTITSVSLGAYIETNWQGLLLLLVNPFAGAFKLIYDNCEGFRTKVNEVVSAVLNTLRELPAQVLSVGRNLVEGLWNGINDKLLWLKDKIKSFTESVLDSIEHFFGVNSPSKKTAWIGDMLDQGLASGLLDNMQDPVRAMQRVSDGVLSAAGGTYQTQMSAMQTACAPAAGNVGISAVLERMDRLERAITSMQIYMDGNAVVGAVAQRMDAALGDIYRQNERRAVYGV